MPRLTRWSVAAAAVVCLGCVNLFHPLARGEWVGNIGDGRWNMYLLEHHYKVLTDRQYPGTYSSAPFWVPDHRNNLAYSDLMAGGEPLYAPARLFLSRDQASQVFLVLSALVNFGAFWLLALEAGAGPVAAIAAAGVYAFGAHRVQHLGHTQFALQAWGALALWSLLRFLRLRRSRYVAGFVFALGLQTATAAYAGYMLMMGACLWIAFWAVLNPGEFREVLAASRRDALSWLGAATAAAIVPLLLLTPYLRMFGGALRRDWWEVKLHLPTADFWFQPLAGTLLDHVRASWSALPPVQECHSAGLAVWLAVAAGLALWWRSRQDARLRLMAASAAVALVLLALVTRWTADGWTLWRMLYDHVPGADGMRDVRRISIAANTFLILAAALAAGRLLQTRGGRTAALALAALALAENAAPHRNHYARDWYRDASQEIRTAMRGAGVVGAFLDPEVPDYAFNYNLQFLGQETNVPLLNGSSGRYIPGYPPIIRPADVLSKGDRLDFNGLLYLVPRTAERGLGKELAGAGMSLIRRGNRFALYTPAPENPAYDVEFRPQAGPELRARPEEAVSVPVVVVNRSGYVWQTFGASPTQVIYRINRERDSGPGANGETTDLPGATVPGAMMLVNVKIRAPREPGAYRIRLAMVRQGRAIFEPATPASGGHFTLRVE